MSFRGKRVFKDGKWEDGKAAPQQLREDLAALPSELLTADIEDNNKIHELDPEHTNRELLRNFHTSQAVGADVGVEPTSAETRKEDNAKLAAVLDTPDYRARPPIVQYLVDIERMRTIRTLMANAIFLYKHGATDEQLDEFIRRPRHLWFPEDTTAVVELRENKWAPRSSMRPRRLRDIDLNVDMLHWPEQVMDKLAQAGFAWKQPDRMLEEMKAYVRAEHETEAALDRMDANGE